ncbi:MAG: alpha/beta hydrolase [Dehalococcoidia bacterium]|nr:alpha/beta hydrolase [Dehalococcoidia bacterium]
MALIARRFVYTPSGRRAHYRRVGDGPPLVMLHPSPTSSFGMEPRMARLAHGHTVIALDTPGYGESALLPIDHPTVGDYADALAETLSALQLPRVDLYGNHTGATIALEFAVRYPERVRRLILDGVSVYTPEEKADRLAHYTPSLEPQWDASHILRAWTMMRDMRIFSPWYRRQPANRIHRALPSAEALHATMVDFLRAGKEYWRGYHAVFQHHTAEALQQLSVPTLVTSSVNDTLRFHLERVMSRPGVVTVRPAAEEAQLARNILDFLEEGDPLDDAPPPVPVVSLPGVVRRDYLDVSIGQVLTRRADGGPNRPLIVLHAMPGSSLIYERIMPVWSEDRTVVAFDLPGNGDSSPMHGEPTIQDFARVIGEAIDRLGFESVDLYGAHTGALIATEIAIERPRQVKHVILDGVTLFSAEQTADLLAHYFTPITPRDDGTQFLWAWHFRREMALWWPWYNHTEAGLRPEGAVPPADVLHTGYVEFIKGALTYHLSYRAAFSYPTRERLPLLTVPVLHACNEHDPLRACVPEAKQLAPHGESRIHPGMATPDAMAITLGYYRAFLADQPIPAGPTE